MGKIVKWLTIIFLPAVYFRRLELKMNKEFENKGVEMTRTNYGKIIIESISNGYLVYLEDPDRLYTPDQTIFFKHFKEVINFLEVQSGNNKR